MCSSFLLTVDQVVSCDTRSLPMSLCDPLSLLVTLNRLRQKMAAGSWRGLGALLGADTRAWGTGSVRSNSRSCSDPGTACLIGQALPPQYPSFFCRPVLGRLGKTAVLTMGAGGH